MNATSELEIKGPTPAAIALSHASIEFFLDGLADIFDVERQLSKTLPRMAEAACAWELREALQVRFLETLNHLGLLKEIVASLQKPLPSKSCLVMQMFAQEMQALTRHKNSSARDAALILAARKVQQYETLACGRLIAWAEQEGLKEIVDLLSETFFDAQATDNELKQLGRSLAVSESSQPTIFAG